MTTPAALSAKQAETLLALTRSYIHDGNGFSLNKHSLVSLIRRDLVEVQGARCVPTDKGWAEAERLFDLGDVR